MVNGEENQNTENMTEFVEEINGVKYYLHRISGEPSRTLDTYNSFNQRVVLILAGYDENIPSDLLGETIIQKARHLILPGQASSRTEMAVMRKMAGKYRDIDLRITKCNTLQQAVDCAFLSAKPGEAVVLSCTEAGFDGFDSFDKVKNAYREYVHGLQ